MSAARPGEIPWPTLSSIIPGISAYPGAGRVYKDNARVHFRAIAPQSPRGSKEVEKGRRGVLGLGVCVCVDSIVHPTHKTGR